MARLQAAAAGVREHRCVDLSPFAGLIEGGSALTGPAREVPDLAGIAPEARRQPPTYVPNRNMVFLSLAAAFAETRAVRRVFYGAQQQDEYGYWDCSQEFVDRLNRVLRLNRGPGVTVEAPFAGKRKAEVLKIGLALGVNYAHTWTCYRGGPVPCGTCPSCVERAAAFRELGVSDPLCPQAEPGVCPNGQPAPVPCKEKK